MRTIKTNIVPFGLVENGALYTSRLALTIEQIFQGRIIAMQPTRITIVAECRRHGEAALRFIQPITNLRSFL
jgi:hypothetical protein